jgi:hypothetical protein
MDQAVRLVEFRVGYGHGGVTVLEGLWMLFVEYLVLLVLMESTLVVIWFGVIFEIGVPVELYILMEGVEKMSE